MLPAINNVSVNSKPDHSLQANPREFFKWLIPHPWAQRQCEIPIPGAENRAKTPPPGPLFSLKSSKKNTKHETENGTEMLTDV